MKFYIPTVLSHPLFNTPSSTVDVIKCTFERDTMHYSSHAIASWLPAAYGPANVPPPLSVRKASELEIFFESVPYYEALSGYVKHILGTCFLFSSFYEFLVVIP